MRLRRRDVRVVDPGVRGHEVRDAGVRSAALRDMRAEPLARSCFRPRPEDRRPASSSAWRCLVSLGIAVQPWLGCIDGAAPPRALEEGPAVVGLLEQYGLAPDETVGIVLTAPVRVVTSEWPVTVTDPEGRRIGASGDAARGHPRIDIVPDSRWPEGTILTLTIGQGFQDDDGRPLRLPRTPLSFETAPTPAVPLAAEIVFPVPGQRAASNTRVVVLRALSPASIPRRLVLSSTDDQVMAVHELTGERHHARYRILARDRGCPWLCPGQKYVARGDVDPDVSFPSGPRGEVLTSTVPDDAIPAVLRHSILRESDRLAVTVEATEPVLLGGWIERATGAGGPEGSDALGSADAAVGPDTADVGDGSDPASAPGERESLVGGVVLAREGCVESATPLESNAAYRVGVFLEDAAGHRTEIPIIEARTRPRVSVSISEIVATPLRDWGDSGGGGRPFDESPGTGAVTDSDEWVELVNMGDAAIDLTETRLVLAVNDGSPSLTELANPPAFFFGSGGTVEAWWPGEAVVVRPRGQMAARGSRIEVLEANKVLDGVSLGLGGDHPGGSPPDVSHEAISRDAIGRFRWCVPTPGESSPGLDCVDP